MTEQELINIRQQISSLKIDIDMMEMFANDDKVKQFIERMQGKANKVKEFIYSLEAE